MKILIVDDEDMIREVIKEYSEDAGYQTDEAENGKIALKKINKNENTPINNCLILIMKKYFY